MRRQRALACSFVKNNAGTPEQVQSDAKTNSSEANEKNNSNTRKLRSNSRSASSSRPIRINRDCLKGIPVARDRVVKRSTSTENGIATHRASAKKPRAQVPGITNVKAVVKQSTAPPTTRVLRSHAVAKTTTAIQSTKTETRQAVKVSTATQPSTPTSTRILRSHVSSARGTTDAKSSIPRFAWKLRSRSSVSKPGCNASKDSESKPLRKRRAREEAGSITATKRLASKPELQVAKTEQKETSNVLGVKKSPPQKQPKKANLQKPQDELKLSNSGLEKVEIKTLIACKEQSSDGIENAGPASQQPKVRPDEQQGNTKDPNTEEQGTKPGVQEQACDERPITPAADEVNKEILCEDVEVNAKDEVVEVAGTLLANEITEEHLLVANAETEKSDKSLVNRKPSLMKEPPAKDSFISDEKAALPENSEVDVLSESMPECKEKRFDDDSSAAKSQVEEEVASTTPDVVSKNCGGAFPAIVKDISLVKTTAASGDLQEAQLPDHATKISASSQEKLSGAKVETPSVGKEKTEKADVCASTSALKPPSTEGISLQAIIPQNAMCTLSVPPVEKPTFVEAVDKTLTQNLSPAAVVEEQFNPAKTTSPCSETTAVPLEQSIDISPVNESALVQPVAQASPEIVLAEAKMVAKEQLNPAITPVCSKPFQDLHDKSPPSKDRKSPSESPPFASAAATKRPASPTAVENGLLVKKKRDSSSEIGQAKSSISALPIQFSVVQRMEVESPIPAVSTQAMEVDVAANLAVSFTFKLPSSRPSGQNMSEDMEVGDWGSTQKSLFLFGGTQPVTCTPVFGSKPFGQQGRQVSLSIKPATSHQYTFGSTKANAGPGFNGGNIFGNVPQKPILFGGVFNQRTSTPVKQVTFGGTPSAPPLPSGGFKQTAPNLFGNLARQSTPRQFGGSFNQINGSYVFGSRPFKLTNSSGPQRKFIVTKGVRRRNEVKPPCNQSLVFGNGPQLSPQQVFGGFGIKQNATPMESDDSVGSLNYQPSQALRPATFGQSIVGGIQCQQNPNDHPMEEATPIPSNGTFPQRNAFSCFAMTTQTRPAIQRTFSLPQITATAVVPRPPLILKPPRLIAPSSLHTGFTNSTNHADIACPSLNDTTIDVTRCETMEMHQAKTALHKIYSSVSSLNSSCSDASLCQSEIEAFIDNLSESMSNCSLEDGPELGEIGKLIEKFKTMTITDKPSNCNAKTPEQ